MIGRAGRERPPMPFVPLVSASELRNTIGTISPKPERDDREVVAAEAERRRTQQDAEQRRDTRPTRSIGQKMIPASAGPPRAPITSMPRMLLPNGDATYA